MELMRDPTAVYSGVPHPSESQDSNLVPAENLEPRIVPRAEHRVSRKDIDADALKVLYRLKNHGFVAYLVGGGVRDLLLERRPKDFDIATSAHPQQVQKLFRNCFIGGPPLPAVPRALRQEGGRGLDLPQAGRGGGGRTR